MTESEVAKFLASSDSPPPPSAASAAEIHISAASPEEEECVVCCDTYPCAGGSWVGGMFQPCQKRPTTNAVRHSRGLVCILHHEFVKCQQCRLHVHVGCFVPKGTFYTPIHRDFLWTCQKCTLKPQSNDVKNEECTLTSESKVSPTFECTLPSEGNKLKTTSKCMFQNRQLLLQHISDHGWIIRGSTPRRIYFCCKKCALTFRAKAQDADIETGEWCAINMPSDHECCNLGFKRVATSVTTRVCNLPIDVFNEIQRLACCKAFCSLSITVSSLTQHSFLTSDIVHAPSLALVKWNNFMHSNRYQCTLHARSALQPKFQARRALGDTYELVFQVDASNPQAAPRLK